MLLALVSLHAFATPVSWHSATTLSVGHYSQAHTKVANEVLTPSELSPAEFIYQLNQQCSTTSPHDTPIERSGNQTQQTQSPSRLAAIIRGQIGVTEFEALSEHEPSFEVVEDFTSPLPVVAVTVSVTPQISPFYYQPRMVTRYRLSGWKETNSLYVHLNAHV